MNRYFVELLLLLMMLLQLLLLLSLNILYVHGMIMTLNLK